MELYKVKNQVKGELILPPDSNSDEAPSIYNVKIDKEPTAILVCRNSGDVSNGGMDNNP